MILKMPLIVILFVLLCDHSALGKIKPGVWVDDGFGQTVRADIDPIEAKYLEKDMLHALGLPKPPKHRKHRPTGSAPNYLQNIYESLDERGKAPRLDPWHRMTVGIADTIITFVNRNPVSERHKNKANRILHFNMADVSLDYSLLGAELRIHRRKMHHHHEDLMFHVYQITGEGQDELITEMPLHHEGWTSINVTSASLSWILFPKTNHGIRLAVTKPGLKHEMHLDEAGLSGAHAEENSRPFVVGFFGIPQSSQFKNINKRKRRASRSVSSKNSYSSILSDYPNGQNRDHICQRMQLHVSFRDLAWDRWVIAPDGYDAYFCSGKCEFPIPTELNATNHAYIQTLVSSLGAVKTGEDLPPPSCCAPKDLTTISVLYYDYAQNVHLKKYRKMIVKSCGCV